MYPAHFMRAMTMAYASFSRGVDVRFCPSARTRLQKATGTCLPDNRQKWPKGLTKEDGKLYRNGKLLVPESRVLELCEAWHHHMMHPGVKKQALDMQRRFEIDEIGLYNAIKQVKKGCSVCQACNPGNRNVKGEAQ